LHEKDSHLPVAEAEFVDHCGVCDDVVGGGWSTVTLSQDQLWTKRRRQPSAVVADVAVTESGRSVHVVGAIHRNKAIARDALRTVPT